MTDTTRTTILPEAIHKAATKALRRELNRAEISYACAAHDAGCTVEAIVAHLLAVAAPLSPQSAGNDHGAAYYRASAQHCDVHARRNMLEAHRLHHLGLLWRARALEAASKGAN